MKTERDQFVSGAEAARLTGLSVSTIVSLAERGMIAKRQASNGRPVYNIADYMRRCRTRAALESTAAHMKIAASAIATQPLFSPPPNFLEDIARVQAIVEALGETAPKEAQS